MASFDTDAHELNAFDFDAFSLDFHLGLGVDNLVVAEPVTTIGVVLEVITNTPPALVVTAYNVTLDTISFENDAFDGLASFDTDAFSLEAAPGVAVTATSDTLSLTNLNATLLAPAHITTGAANSLALTPYNVTISTDDITATLDALTLSTHQVSLTIGPEIISATDVLALTATPASISRSLDGNAANLALTTYPVGLAKNINIGTTGLTVNPQVVSIDFTPGGFIEVGTSLDSLVVTEHAASIFYSVKFTTTAVVGLNQSNQPALINFGRLIEPPLVPLTVTTYPTIIGFNWEATMGVDRLYMVPRRVNENENAASITQPIPDDLPYNIPINF